MGGCILVYSGVNAIDDFMNYCAALTVLWGLINFVFDCCNFMTRFCDGKNDNFEDLRINSDLNFFKVR